MKLVHRDISDKSKDTSGSVTVVPEETEDMWHIYNLIAIGDYVRASTIRKVTVESTTGSTTSNRIRTILTVQVEGIDFDTAGGMLRLKESNAAGWYISGACRGGMHQIFPQFFYDFSFYNSSPSQSGCTKRGIIVEEL
jgi:hypothetical protein